MSQELLNKAVAGSIKSEPPQFSVGDTVNVSVKIVEGEKERIQAFRGTVIARGGKGVGETFTVRRIVNNEGVERVFPVHSPQVLEVEVIRSGKTRRSKLYFLRDRVGKSTRLRDIQTVKGKSKARIVTPEPEPEAEQVEAAEGGEEAGGEE